MCFVFILLNEDRKLPFLLQAECNGICVPHDFRQARQRPAFICVMASMYTL